MQKKSTQTESAAAKEMARLRKQKGMTQAELAAALGISQRMVAACEAGERRPSVELAMRIGALLGFPWTWFYADDTEGAGDVVAGGEDPDAAGASADGADGGRVS